MTLPPFDPDTVFAVFRSVGYALWQVQALENVLVHYLVMVHQVAPGVAREQAEAVFEKAGKRTMGQLLTALRDGEGEGAPLIVRLEAFVDDRNWLVHRSRHQNHTDLYDPGRARALLARLDTVADEALSLMKGYQAALEAHLTANGVSKETIDRNAAAIMRSWAAG